MDNPQEPLLGKTTANKLLVAAIAGSLTALFGWLTVAELDSRATDLMVKQELSALRSWLEENENHQLLMTRRIDMLYEIGVENARQQMELKLELERRRDVVETVRKEKARHEQELEDAARRSGSH